MANCLVYLIDCAIDRQLAPVCTSMGNADTLAACAIPLQEAALMGFPPPFLPLRPLQACMHIAALVKKLLQAAESARLWLHDPSNNAALGVRSSLEAETPEVDRMLQGWMALPAEAVVDPAASMPAIERLALALQRYYELPERQQEGLLELAQAVAVRNCAYLRCADTSGPPEGERAPGQLKCSGCKTVRFCGTACSGAAWLSGPTGGHKRVCKALAAVCQQAVGAAAAGAAGP